jgi:hypothetical protein
VPGTGPLVGTPEPPAPRAFAARGPFPSPCLGEAARLSFTLPRAGLVRIEVADVGGRRVRVDDLGRREAGEVRFTLPARDGSGSALPPGLYFVRVRAGELGTVRRWVVAS